MATRFYLPDGGTAAYTPAQLSGWEVTTSFTSFPTDVTKSNTTIGAGAARQKGSTVAWDDRLDRVFVSTKQLASQTISTGTLSAVIRAVESATGADAFLQVMVRVVSANGATQRGVLFSGSTQTAVSATASAENGEYGTTSSTRIKSAATMGSASVVAQAGDRLQIEVGYRFGSTTSTVTATHRYGDATGTADFALTSGLTTDLCPWVELSQNLTWWAPAGTGTGSWSFSGAGVGTAPATTPALRGNALANDGTSTATTTVAFTIPADAATDGTDYAIVTLNAKSSGVTVSAVPSGWTLLSGPQATSVSTAFLYGKTLGVGDPGATATWTLSSAVDVGHMSVYRNVNGASPIVATPTVDDTAGTTIDLPTASVPAGALVHAHIALFVSSPPAADVSTPSGYSAGSSPRVASNSITSNVSTEHAYKVAGTAGSYGGETATIDVSARGVVFLVGLASSTTKVGSGTGAWSFTGTGSGTRTSQGMGSGSWSFAGAGSGEHPRNGSGTGTWTFTGAGTGKRPAGGAGTGAWAFAGAGLGSLPAKGSGTGAWTFAGVGTGEHPRIGTGSGTWTWVGAGEGYQPTVPSHVIGTAVLVSNTGTAVLTVTLGTATLASDGLHTAELDAQTLATATIDTA